MKKSGTAGAAVWRVLVLEPFAVKWSMLVVLLLAAVPMIHAAIAPYIKLFLLWGIAVGTADIFRRRRAIRNRYAAFWAVFTLGYAVSILLNHAAGFFENLPDLAYMALFFFVLFPYDAADDPAKAEREIGRLAGTFAAVSFLLSACSLATLLLGIHYQSTVYISENVATPIVLGVAENRLYGIYNSNTGSAIAVISMAFSLLLLLKKGACGRVGRVLLIVNMVCQYTYLALSLSRGAGYMFLIFTALVIFLVLPIRFSARRSVAELCRAGLAVTAVAVLILLNGATRAVCSHIPATLTPAGRAVMVRLDEWGILEVPESVLSPDGDAADTPPTFERVENTEEDGVLTGRDQLWRGGWQTFLEKPLFGATREGMYLIADKYLEAPLQQSLLRGGLHNLFVMVLACSGAVGLVTLTACLAVSAVRAVRRIWRRRATAEGLTLNLLGVLLVTVLGMEMLETRLLYTTTVFGAVFWMMYGYTMWLTDAIELEKL